MEKHLAESTALWFMQIPYNFIRKSCLKKKINPTDLSGKLQIPQKSRCRAKYNVLLILDWKGLTIHTCHIEIFYCELWWNKGISKKLLLH